ncbi:MAG: CRISPR-associated protein Csn1 [Paludibacteraceae bacterium]|nr:CRISPR-associated protein Csn1 [Paludibacteraceae bacterium]
MENEGKQRILGIDTGTNSLGWAVVDRLPHGGYELIDKGVNIFQEGVNIEKGTIEKSRAAERTSHRSLRKQYWRRKIRKIRLLSILSNAGLCPSISSEELHLWRTDNKYPIKNEAFMRWQRTDDKKGINPYSARCRCVEENLDMACVSDRYLLGRALYHIAQRRGFLSNRKAQTDDKDTGVVKDGIKELTQKIHDAGCEYLCQYFYKLYQQGERIRCCYTDRKEHYEAEFNAICNKQQLDENLVAELYKVIFVQRPLKSQRRGVAKCPFEPSKRCAPISHPLFEEFRMWSFIRNIKIQTPADNELRVLNDEEIEKVLHLWYRKSKPNFHFEEVAKAIAGKGKYCYYLSAEEKPYRFNYHLDTNIAGCPITAQLREIFGEDILTNRENIDKIWQALDFYDDDLKLREWGMKHFAMDDEQADAFVKIRLPQGYASLSLKAMENIVPLMRGHRMNYSSATLIAKLRDLLKKYNFDEEIDAYLINDIEDYLTIPTDKSGKPLMSREERRTILEDKWRKHYNLSIKDIQKLYHPSMIEEYRKVENKTNGVYQLGSPRISALKNPMAMRALFRMKAVVNQLLKEGTIDENTIIHIEFARELNDANRRAALRSYQSDLRKERDAALETIKEYVSNPSEDDILKYLLWTDQGGKCIYTGRSISIKALFQGTEFDIEHTIPRSIGGNSTRENLTICDAHFNREIKKNMLPSQLSLSKQEIILAHIQEWKEKYEDLDKQIRKLKGSASGLGSKEAKDRVITKRHKLEMQRDFWRNKYNAFVIKEEDVQGFTRRQGTDISVINRYGRLYLLSLFNRVDVVKGSMTAAFRKIWGIQTAYDKKNRTNHVHHCIDAITIACMGKREYDELSAFYHADEQNRFHQSGLLMSKPWMTFTEDIKSIEQQILVAHYTNNPMGKRTRKRVRDSRGMFVYNKNNQPIFATGDTARGALHLDTQYGAIQNDGQIRYVLRMAIDDSRLNVENIVDQAVREKVQDVIARYGSIAKALEVEPIWMNKAKGIAIKKVRTFASITEPLHIRHQRDVSKHEYKRTFHVDNKENYLFLIYEGQKKDGTIMRTYSVISNLEAAKRYNSTSNNQVIPQTDENGNTLKMILKVGSLVLLYKDTPNELYHANTTTLVQRLYKIVGFGKDGRIKIRYQQEAREAKELGAWLALDYNCLGAATPAQSRIGYAKFNALVEGIDFEMSETGKITFKRC